MFGWGSSYLLQWFILWSSHNVDSVGVCLNNPEIQIEAKKLFALGGYWKIRELKSGQVSEPIDGRSLPVNSNISRIILFL